MILQSNIIPLEVRPFTVKQAQKINFHVHRKLKKVQGAMWALCLREIETRKIRGVAIVGWPARVWNELGILCLLRVAVEDGVYNGCSMLYGSCSRAAKGMGASALVTYTHMDEPGTSLKASGWIESGISEGGEWDCESRPRQKALFADPKRRWFAPWSNIPETVMEDSPAQAGIRLAIESMKEKKE